MRRFFLTVFLLWSCLTLASCAGEKQALQRQPASGSARPRPPKSAADSRQQEQIVYARTDDGWNLALHHYASSGDATHPTPVLLCHGMSSNSAFWDLDGAKGGPTSFARYLSRQGFDVWSVDLRGCGKSSKAGWVSRDQVAQEQVVPTARFGKEDWTIDDTIHLDIPAILRVVREESQQPQVNWVGHGMGASVLAGFLVTHDGNSIKSFTAIGMPILFPKPVNDILTDLAKPKNADRLSAIFNAASNLSASMEELFFHESNVDDAGRNAMRVKASEAVPPGVLEQFAQCVRSGEFLSSDKRTSYAKGLEKITVPILFAAGPLDNLASVTGVYETYGRVSSIDKTLRVFQKANGHSADYGHQDLIIGRSAPDDVYPFIAAWLSERS